MMVVHAIDPGSSTTRCGATDDRVSVGLPSEVTCDACLRLATRSVHARHPGTTSPLCGSRELLPSIGERPTCISCRTLLLARSSREPVPDVEPAGDLSTWRGLGNELVQLGLELATYSLRKIHQRIAKGHRSIVVPVLLVLFVVACGGFPSEGTDEPELHRPELPDGHWVDVDEDGSSSSSAAGDEDGSSSAAPGTSSHEDGSSSSSAAGDEDGSSSAEPVTSSDEDGSSSSSTGEPDTCAHDVCSGGGELEASCSSCVADVCELDPYCCDRGWDADCIAHAVELCGAQC
jgi:hypothetical protein